MADERMRLPGDAALIRYLDGELDAAEMASLESALEKDSALRARLERLRRRGERLGERLRDVDPVPADRLAVNPFREGRAAAGAARSSTVLWLKRAAAVVLLLAGAVSLVPPLRALVVTQLQRVIGAAPAVDTGPAGVLSDVAPDTIDVSFATASSLDFELLHWQRAGTLRVRVEEVAEAAAAIHSRSGLEAFHVFPGGVRVDNASQSVADYELVVPVSVRLVRITIEGERVAEYATLAPENRERTFDVVRER